MPTPIQTASQIASDNGSRGMDHGRRTHRVAMVLVVIIIAALITFVAVVGSALKRSADDIMAQSTVAIEAGQLLSDDLTSIIPDIAYSLKNLNTSGLSSAQSAARNAEYASQTINDAVNEIQDDLNDWPWAIVDALPYLNTDIDFARDLVNDTSEFTDTLPSLAQSLDDVINNNAIASGTISLDAVSNDVENAKSLVASLQATRDAAQTSSAAIKALPTPHFNQLNTARNQLANTIDSINASFERYAEQLDAAAEVVNAL